MSTQYVWTKAGMLITLTSVVVAGMSFFSATPSFGLLFMDDNAPIHRAAVVNEWMENYGISRLMWPPYSPDISPIENLWAYLKRHLLQLRPQPTNMEDLLEKMSHYLE